MKITAEEIDRWSQEKINEAIDDFPRLLRRLAHAKGVVSYADMPGGKAVFSPGLDGLIEARAGCAWVPEGKSFWEFTCKKGVQQKADDDYNKRTREIDAAVRQQVTFVFATARTWPGKRKWADEKKKAAEWRDTRAYDAGDLEQWLEQAPAARVWFLEKLYGRAVTGIESLDYYWREWAQTDPALTLEAFRSGRESLGDYLLHRIQEGKDRTSIRADSREEAAAFAVATLMQAPDPAEKQNLEDRAVVITDPEGWRYVEANPGVRTVIAVRPDKAPAQVPANIQSVIYVFSMDDRSAYFQGMSADAADDEGVIIRRPLRYEFEDALAKFGKLDRGEAESRTREAGRSWSIYRRLYAGSPAIRQPAWLDSPAVDVLSTICLAGFWNSDSRADQEIIQRIAGCPCTEPAGEKNNSKEGGSEPTCREYEETEKKLGELLECDDSPVIRIGKVWKAKSPFELLHQFGVRITDSEIDRFLAEVKVILLTPDPALDLPPNQRFMANYHGKVRPVSGLLFASLCDALPRLAVASDRLHALQGRDIGAKITRLVEDVLKDAGGKRWLSLTRVLPSLAEAAPREFLTAVESSMGSDDKAVQGLFAETQPDIMFGQNCHAEFLWALERLAWSPRYVSWVAEILAQLCSVEIKGNWGDTPLNSLARIFHSRMPQTSISVEDRIKILDLVLKKSPDAGWRLLEALFPPSRTGTYSARPRWRDDDRAAGDPVTYGERNRMLKAVVERQMNLAEDDASKTARLIRSMDYLDEQGQNLVLDLVERFIGKKPGDDARAVLRDGIRHRIHYIYIKQWRKDTDQSGLDESLKRLKSLYDSAEPTDPMVRHAWLFAAGREAFDLPEPVRDDDMRLDERIDQLRKEAVDDILAEGGLEKIETLMGMIYTPGQSGYSPGQLGWALGQSTLEDEKLIEWLASAELEGPLPYMDVVRGCTLAMKEERQRRIIDAVMEQGYANGWSPGQQARFLAACPFDRRTWERAEREETIKTTYWREVSTWPPPEEVDDLDYMRHHLLEAGRPVAAFDALSGKFDRIPPLELLDLLERVNRGEERLDHSMSGYYLRQALDAISTDESIPQYRIAMLEFLFYQHLQYGNDQQIKVLFSEITTSPEFFCQLVRLAYIPKSGDKEEDVRDASPEVGMRAREILRDCRRLPGTQENGLVDPDAFKVWTEEARQLCREAGRADIADDVIGEIMAHDPEPKIDDQPWPSAPVRDLLEESGNASIREGFKNGIINKRGVSVRGYADGGDQERELSARYAGYARALRVEYQKTADVLQQMADYYEKDAEREDRDTLVRLEQDG